MQGIIRLHPAQGRFVRFDTLEHSNLICQPNNGQALRGYALIYRVLAARCFVGVMARPSKRVSADRGERAQKVGSRAMWVRTKQAFPPWSMAYGLCVRVVSSVAVA